MKNFIIALIMGLVLIVSPAFSQDTVSIPVLEPVTDTVAATVQEDGTLVKIDEVVDKLGLLTGVDTLASIDDAYAAVTAKIEEAKALSGSPWYAWLSYAVSILALLFGVWKLFLDKKKE